MAAILSIILLCGCVANGVDSSNNSTANQSIETFNNTTEVGTEFENTTSIMEELNSMDELIGSLID